MLSILIPGENRIDSFNHFPLANQLQLRDLPLKGVSSKQATGWENAGNAGNHNAQERVSPNANRRKQRGFLEMPTITIRIREFGAQFRSKCDEDLLMNQDLIFSYMKNKDVTERRIDGELCWKDRQGLKKIELFGNVRISKPV